MSLPGFSQAAFDESDYRVRHVRDQEGSGLTVAEYCRDHDLCRATFYNWRRLQRECAESGLLRSSVSFTEIGRVAAVQSQWGAEIALPSGAVVRVGVGADAQLLRMVFEALG